MSDILRVTTPLVNKTQVIDTRRSVENLTQFNLPDVTKVTRARSDNALLMQNNVLTGEEKPRRCSWTSSRTPRLP